MDETNLNHLTNLLRHSTAIEFHIPSIFFTETPRLEKQCDEIYQAWKHLSQDSDLEVYKVRQTKTGCITVTVKVKQNGES